MFTLPSKSASLIRDAFKEVVTWYRRYGCVVKIVRSDYEQVFQSEEFQEYLKLPEINIRHEASIPYQHYQNAVERDVQTIVNGTATLLLAQSWLRKDCWDLAMFHYVDVRNKTPNVRGTAPYQLITKENWI